ncbi:MAG: hypothetical protein SF028_01270 [Candidatus Sumerlaeia bacterium]|nr:hypothetical protein [Candidatus Sumerlaeia bacterium]
MNKALQIQLALVAAALVLLLAVAIFAPAPRIETISLDDVRAELEEGEIERDRERRQAELDAMATRPPDVDAPTPAPTPAGPEARGETVPPIPTANREALGLPTPGYNNEGRLRPPAFRETHLDADKTAGDIEEMILAPDLESETEY